MYETGKSNRLYQIFKKFRFWLKNESMTCNIIDLNLKFVYHSRLRSCKVLLDQTYFYH